MKKYLFILHCSLIVFCLIFISGCSTPSSQEGIDFNVEVINKSGYEVTIEATLENNTPYDFTPYSCTVRGCDVMGHCATDQEYSFGFVPAGVQRASIGTFYNCCPPIAWLEFIIEGRFSNGTYKTITSRVSLSSGIVSNPSQTFLPDWTGTWDIYGIYDTFIGKMWLTQNVNIVTGTYNIMNGTISGIVEGNKLTGTFVQSDATGTFEFTLTPDGKSFTGGYYITGEGIWKKWSGIKVS